MTGLVMFLLVIVGFLFLFSRSVRAGYGPLLFWLVWFVGGLCLILALPSPAPAGVKLLVNLWAWSVPALAVLFVAMRLIRGPRRSP